MTVDRRYRPSLPIPVVFEKGDEPNAPKSNISPPNGKLGSHSKSTKLKLVYSEAKHVTFESYRWHYYS